MVSRDGPEYVPDGPEYALDGSLNGCAVVKGRLQDQDQRVVLCCTVDSTGSTLNKYK